MRVVFAGTPAPALPSLAALIASDHDVVAVVTRPDAPTGRGRKLAPSEVAVLAADHGIPVLKPMRPAEPDFVRSLSELNPDACPVVAYGALLPSEVLAIPKYGWINLHFSLLPAWRGAAPVQHAIWHGDELTGATTFRLDEGMDTGPVFGTVVTPIRPTDTAGDLLGELADSGAHLLTRTLDAIESGEVVAVPQPNEGVSMAPKISTDDARVDWRTPAIAIDRQIRACTPAPGAWTTRGDDRLKLGPVRVRLDAPTLAPGQLAVGKREVLVGTATSAVELSTVRAPGKREMAAPDWARGAQLGSDVVLT